MSHLDFYRSNKLVELLREGVGGNHPGYRAVHAQGRFYAGTFTGTPEGKRLTRAAHIQADNVPVTVRCSPSVSGDPVALAGNITAMSTKFYLPDGQVTDLVAVNIPVFLVKTPDEMIEFLSAFRPDPATGRQDAEKIQAFLANHAAAARAYAVLQQQPAPVSFAQTAYHAIHAYRFVNERGEGRFARYHWEPEAGVAGESIAELQARPRDYLYQELEERLGRGPVAFSLVLELAEDGDPTDDSTAPWPEGRQRVTIGRLEITCQTSPEELGDRVMVHDPTRLTDGIELSDDPILIARRGIYAASVAARTGGWQRQQERAGAAATTKADAGTRLTAGR